MLQLFWSPWYKLLFHKNLSCEQSCQTTVHFYISFNKLMQNNCTMITNQKVFVHGLRSLILACCRASVANHLASDCEQNWETWCALELICPDRTRAFNLLGGGRGLNSLFTSSSGSGSSPRATRAVLSCCRFWRNRVLSWHCLTARFWDLLNFIDS